MEAVELVSPYLNVSDAAAFAGVAKYRLQGEWFKPSRRVLDFIGELLSTLNREER